MRPSVHGVDLDTEARCAHWHSPRDIVAIKLKCCGAYYACRECHDMLADHAAQTWPKNEMDEKAVLCGACGTELTIAQYLGCENICPHCEARFNPGCSHHHHLYFDMAP